MKKTVLRNYAKLIVRMGANVQKGQEVILMAALDQPEFVRMVAEECYRAGAKKVNVEWSYDQLTKLNAKWQKEEVLGATEEWEKAKYQHMVDVLPARIWLESDDPDVLADVPQPKYSNAVQARARVRKPYRDAIDNKHQWTIAGVPGKAWAKKMFPELTSKQAEEKLWEAILMTSRALEDPLEAWKEHNKDLHKRCDHLNSLGLRKLHYSASNGTDFTVGLMENSIFCGGSSFTLKGVEYNANIPSNEVFTAPMKGDAEGILYASKPLSYQGALIENFSIRFEKGKAVEVHAEKNEALLRSMIEMDEGAAYLGECALVPAGSPIDACGLLFYSTLYDENASCHFALGDGYAECIRGFENMTREECRAQGLNDSIIHVDFMVGTKDLNIEGIDLQGKRVPIFENGVWAF